MNSSPSKMRVYDKPSSFGICKHSSAFDTMKVCWPAPTNVAGVHDGSAVQKVLPLAYSSPSPKHTSAMKNYLFCIAAQMKHHFNFVLDNAGVAAGSLLTGFAAWALELTEIYIFSDFRFMVFLLLMVAYDAYSGIQKTRYLHKLNPALHPAPSSKVFKDKTFSKIMYYVIMLTSLHGLAHFKVNDVEVTIFHAFEYTAMISLMASEFWSIQENYAAMGRKTLFTLAWQKIKEYVPAKNKIDHDI